MKSKLAGGRYVLAVKDLKASADFYKNKLGFKTLWADDGWHFIISDNVKIMLGECPDERSAHELGDHSYFAYFEIESIDELYNEYVLNKVEYGNALLVSYNDGCAGMGRFIFARR